MRLASPFGSSYCLFFTVQIKATNAKAATPNAIGIRKIRVSIIFLYASTDYFLYKRNAFKLTITDDIDIAKAAIGGVTKPKIAIGTVIKL